MGRSDAGRLSVTTYVVPPVAIALGWLFLGEVPLPLAVVGGAVSLVGVAISRRRGHPGRSWPAADAVLSRHRAPSRTSAGSGSAAPRPSTARRRLSGFAVPTIAVCTPGRTR